MYYFPFLFQYFIIVLLLFIILLIGGILGYVFRDKAETTVNHAMMSAMKEYKINTELPVTKAWDETQQAVRQGYVIKLMMVLGPVHFFCSSNFFQAF